MSREYADLKIREALKIHGGNLTLARQQVMGWASEDSKLLYALARPHLSGIIAYQVERVASGRATREEREPQSLVQEKEIEKLPEKDNFSMDLLRAVASSESAVFGQEGIAVPMRKGKASSQHINAIHHLASRASTKSKKT